MPSITTTAALLLAADSEYQRMIQDEGHQIKFIRGDDPIPQEFKYLADGRPVPATADYRAIEERVLTMADLTSIPAFDPLPAPSNATAIHVQTDTELRAIAKRDRKAKRRHMEALSQYWGTLPHPRRFTDLAIFAIDHLIPPDTLVEWAHKHAPDELL